MASGALRRRYHQKDVNGRNIDHPDASGSAALSEPLLENYRRDENYFEAYIHENHQAIWEQQKRVRLHWTFIFSELVAQWAQWTGKFLPHPFAAQNSLGWNVLDPLSPLQEERLRNLQQRMEIPFDGTRLDHQDALKQLWKLAYPHRELPSLKSELWKEMGWQGPDPSTDFRGGGFISLENLTYFAKKYPNSFQRLLHKLDGNRAEWEYPFAVAGVNISFMLMQMLELQSGKPTTLPGIRFLELLEEDEMAFDNLYCVAFQMMDAQWLAKKASYMEFNEVLKSTRTQLERELSLEDVSSIEDLPAYNLLNR